jgi:Ser/Thr protein kinase RdoA (MazF antagonist)
MMTQPVTSKRLLIQPDRTYILTFSTCRRRQRRDTINKDELQLLLDRLGLGSMESDPQPVLGGLIHHMYRVTTDLGVYALKLLNPTIMARPQAHLDIINGERIARGFAAHGLPAVSAIIGEDGPIHGLGAESVLFFEWVDGSVLDDRVVTTDHCAVIGRLLARMHESRLSIDGLIAPAQYSFGREHWEELMRGASSTEPSWLDDFREALPTLCSLSEKYAAAIPTLRSDTIVSHRDLDLKNVIWRRDGSPAMIDWESGGLVNPMLELIDAALGWCGQLSGTPEKTRFQSLVGAYGELRRIDRAMFEPAFSGCLGARMEWLEFNLQRSLAIATPADERELANRQVLATLVDILALSSRQSEFRAWLENRT